MDCASTVGDHVGRRSGEGGKKIATDERQYRGVRMRKWGKWVAEIREPNKRTRIWLGSYSSPVAAARAYDTAVFYLRGPSAKLNFPQLVTEELEMGEMSAAAIKQKAVEIGARVDAAQAAGIRHHDFGTFRKKPDLNQTPEPETSDED